MAKVPAHCGHCGLQFYSENFIGGSGASGITLKGNRTNCPRCGGWANLADGIFNLHDDQLELVDGPPLTRAMMAQLRLIAEKAKLKAADAEELLAEVAEVSPELAEKIRGRGLPYFVIVLLIIWLIKSVNLNVTVDLNRLIDQAVGAEQSEKPDQLFDIPLPNQPELSPSGSLVYETEIAPLSRQVRRQLERQAHKAYWPKQRDA
ncbi:MULTISPECIES: hypothetical protein [Sphingobium]|uniref:hypothetical protein n=1 Tax=Sphingobium sp. MI1205 TaxID=407020 RepID=UPI0007701EBA|nr:hypothetical protein [Sphingobium sp. MI1205]AMK16919.1 hypothetical protein K663_02650 [Sphingobium sp. MI1205]